MILTQREKAFEDLYAKDQELHFKVRAKRNKIAGEWAASLLGKTDNAAKEYSDKLVSSLLNRQQLFSKLRTDFLLAGVSLSDEEITAKIEQFITQSRKAFMEQMPV